MPPWNGTLTLIARTNYPKRLSFTSSLPNPSLFMSCDSLSTPTSSNPLPPTPLFVTLLLHSPMDLLASFLAQVPWVPLCLLFLPPSPTPDIFHAPPLQVVHGVRPCPGFGEASNMASDGSPPLAHDIKILFLRPLHPFNLSLHPIKI